MSDHDHSNLTGGALRQAFLLTALILIVEAGAGYLSHSLALLSDAGHILTDVVALGFAWFAVVQARRPADQRRTYGYHRAGILTAMLNGAALVLIVIGISYEAARRFLHPEPVQGGIVISAALVAIAVNAYIAVRLRGGGRNLNVLMEGVPAGIDLEQVAQAVRSTDGVDSVHDLHVWSISGQQVALSCHVVVAEELLAAESEHLVRRVEEAVCDRFGIGHTTIQVEACHPCTGEALEHGLGDHNHPHAVDQVGSTR